MFWHIIGVKRLNGYTQEDVLKMQEEPDERFTPFLKDFYSIPKEYLFDYMVIQHGQCVENSLQIPQQKAAACYKQYLQPYFFKLYGPNPASGPLPISQMVEADGGYLSCMKSDG